MKKLLILLSFLILWSTRIFAGDYTNIIIFTASLMEMEAQATTATTTENNNNVVPTQPTKPVKKWPFDEK